MWAIQVITAFVLLTSCNTCKKTNNSNNDNNRDTVLLFRKDTSIIASTVTAVIQCPFSKNTYTDIKTLLILENPRLLTAPEGVYELYLTHQPPEINSLSSLQPEFVTVLDLYSLTAPGAKQQVEVDISKHIKKIFLSTQPPFSFYISIHFGPVILADETYSSQAGELLFSGISIVQVKN